MSVLLLPFCVSIFCTDEGVVLEVDRYDPGRVWREGEGREEVRPTALMADDVPIHLQVCIGGGEGGEMVFNLAQVKSALKVIRRVVWNGTLSSCVCVCVWCVVCVCVCVCVCVVCVCVCVCVCACLRI